LHQDYFLIDLRQEQALTSHYSPSTHLTDLAVARSYRVCSPHETFTRIASLFSACGITRVANITGLDSIGIPVWVCHRPNGRLMSVSQGKGATDEFAKVSAVMESIESYHAEHVRPPDLVGSYLKLSKQTSLLNPRTLLHGPLWSRYIPSMPLGWLRGQHLFSKESILVPRSYVALDRTHPDSEFGLFQVTSNGLASGNTREEAIGHALCELIERHEQFVFYQRSSAARQKRLIDLNSITDSLLVYLLQKFKSAGVDVLLWEIGETIGLSTYECTIVEDGRRSIFAFSGSGCHISKEVAVARALTEAAQSRLTVIAGSRDDTAAEYSKQTEMHKLGATTPNGSLDFAQVGDRLTSKKPLLDLELIYSRLNKAGFSVVIAVDHTRSDIKVPVVHAVVPGLQHALG
jgi:YcaO-like protein with predicted kinase domain